MSLISENVVEELFIWARQNEDAYVFPEVNRETASYYIERTSEETYLREYAVDTLLDLKASLEVYSGLPADSPILKHLLFEISRQRRKQPQRQDNKSNEIKSDVSNSDEDEVQDDKKRLPEHRYVF
ncbi:MAG: hypothetical protein HDR28_01220 [Lachnospiraceae bacterium]|nr:hypothetical protein [Lachnospiraceae bacterium]